MSHHKPNRQRGFTLIETLAAILVLTIGLVGMAVLMSNMMTGGARSRYMSEAAMLASEKLEDLERYPAADPDVAVTSGATAGSLTGPGSCGDPGQYGVDDYRCEGRYRHRRYSL